MHWGQYRGWQSLKNCEEELRRRRVAKKKKCLLIAPQNHAWSQRARHNRRRPERNNLDFLHPHISPRSETCLKFQGIQCLPRPTHKQRYLNLMFCDSQRLFDHAHGAPFVWSRRVLGLRHHHDPSHGLLLARKAQGQQTGERLFWFRREPEHKHR